MCDKAILENGGTLKFVPHCYPHALEFVPECYKTQEMGYKAVHRCFFVFDSISDQYKTQEIFDKVVSLYPFLKIYCSDKCKTQRMYDEAADHFLVALKLIPDWFVTSKMIKKRR